MLDRLTIASRWFLKSWEVDESMAPSGFTTQVFCAKASFFKLRSEEKVTSRFMGVFYRV